MVFVTQADPIAVSPDEIAQGAPTTFSENYRVALDDQYRNNAQFSLEFEFSDAYDENLREIERVTGRKFNAPMNVEAYFDIAGQLEDNPQRGMNFARRETVERFNAQEEQIAALKAEFPELKTAGDIWGEVKKRAQDYEREAADTGDRATFGGNVGGFLGGMVGSFSLRDPVNIGTLGVGGAGRTVLTRILTEMGASGAVETINEFFGVRDNRELLGLENSLERTLTNIGFATAGAGAIRGGGEAVSATLKHLKGSTLSPLTDKQVLDAFKKAVKDPTDTERAAMISMERDIAFIDRENPFESGPEGTSRHIEKLEEAEATLRGESTQTRTDEAFDEVVRPDTSIDRYLEEAQEIKAQLENIADARLDNPNSFKNYIGYRPDSLVDFIIREGGIQDYAGELKARDVTTKSRPGLVRVNKAKVATETGVSVIDNQTDAVLERVFDAGYFPNKTKYDDISPSELYDAIERDLHGEKLYKAEDMEQMAQIVDEAEITGQYDAIGINKNMTAEEIAEVLREDDFSNYLQDAYEDLLPVSFEEQIEFERAAFTADNYDMLEGIEQQELTSQLNDLKSNQGIFEVDGKVDLDEEIPIAAGFDENGEIQIESKKLSDIIKDLDEDDELIQATKGCLL